MSQLLVVGDRVQTSRGPGVLKFLGKLPKRDGEWGGIELDSPDGLNDGTADGIRYFESKEKHGVFLHTHKLVKLNPNPTKSLSPLPARNGSYDVYCAACLQIIPGVFVRVLDKAFHAECFHCVGCKKKLNKTDYKLDSTRKPHCFECFEYICQGCGKVIDGKFVRCKDAKYHNLCFICTCCRHAIYDATYIVRNEKPFCTKCVDIEFSCQECKNVIKKDEWFIDRGTQKIHSSCFKCSVCPKKLDIKSFWEKEGTGPVCDQHWR